ncbi:glycine betaine/L-proline ABC transporter glycine betaine/L-proline-binding/permease [Enterococcus sp. 7E2_DIV0204]|uniref:Glycine betaine/L-proline ABC transporter glycine betaine/L-proline-binding/permease n=1 Tax=Candidatus Enterococcus lemimoniae TaxID=1834167 RepID=A0ABZ2T3Q4_9ENTE|nr:MULTISPECIES: ABC transporter permease/substrate binding protein [unclassified Enterococcus]OTN89893.1 glycine betaine/L-proline ABC transporter glycine betaine/L-proline-binding/permease [Enterococcus sp. 7E2_DIV0204]OTO68755.1 glycine betaine/L-proline ABC transporter glycine betaine/L-proline-binding/permease [Enterococcus sp. 12C11_DIV0727]OTP52349.1 glycine betaine/L-proline ABC transporter glycine betaine/L-proline-binding/permease [Enterococcus sp. 7D2_DIV0200]
MNNYQLPVADWVETITEWMTNTFSGVFSFFQTTGQSLMDGITSLLVAIPPLLFIIILTAIAFFISNKKIGLSLFTLIGLLFIYNQNLWNDLMSTVTLVLLSSVVSIVIGVPLGILMAKSNKAQSIITPILDFMQTMPGFVYLIPAVAFFGIGMVPGVFASVIFALPPTVRFTNLGIRQVPKELVEASDSFGSTGWQKLFKLELPLAKNTIMAGVNQTTMLALSMVVIASMIGAPGLGRGVLSALQRAQVGNGFVNGVALVILAIIIDRFTQNLNKKKSAPTKSKLSKKQKISGVAIAAVAVIALIGGSTLFSSAKNEEKNISLSYVEWDTEVASTHVVGEVLKDIGYNVSLTPLDNAIMWESISKGETDAMVAAWLPGTHGEQYKQYKDKVDDLGENLKGAKLGIVVPQYMDVNSIEDLKDQAGKKITGIEPGAGVVAAAEKTQKAYSNLSDWSVETSSSGAMTVALGQAIKNKEEIVITGWSPHWMFAKYDLKYLEDPKGTMGKEEAIHTMARKGLEKENPEAYNVLKNFHWTKEDMESVMLEINNGTEPTQAARDWIDSHAKEVAEWKK